MKLAVAESLLLAGLLLLSALALMDSVAAGGLRAFLQPDLIAGLIPEQVSREVVVAILLSITLYWALHLLGRDHLAFWVMVLLVTLPQGMAIWGHNQIEWHQLFDFKAGVSDARSQLRDTALFLVSLMGLVALYRAISLRRLDRQMSAQGIEAADRSRLVLNEGVMLLGLIVAGLLSALGMILVSSVLGGFDVLPEESSWSILAVGGGASLLLALTLVLWYRVR